MAKVVDLCDRLADAPTSEHTARVESFVVGCAAHERQAIRWLLTTLTHQLVDAPEAELRDTLVRLTRVHGVPLFKWMAPTRAGVDAFVHRTLIRPALFDKLDDVDALGPDGARTLWAAQRRSRAHEARVQSSHATVVEWTARARRAALVENAAAFARVRARLHGPEPTPRAVHSLAEWEVVVRSDVAELCHKPPMFWTQLRLARLREDEVRAVLHQTRALAETHGGVHIPPATRALLADAAASLLHPGAGGVPPPPAAQPPAREPSAPAEPPTSAACAQPPVAGASTGGVATEAPPPSPALAPAPVAPTAGALEHAARALGAPADAPPTAGASELAARTAARAGGDVPRARRAGRWRLLRLLPTTFWTATGQARRPRQQRG